MLALFISVFVVVMSSCNIFMAHAFSFRRVTPFESFTFLRESPHNSIDFTKLNKASLIILLQKEVELREKEVAFHVELKEAIKKEVAFHVELRHKDVEILKTELGHVNTELLKLQGNLNIRGLIEAFEQKQEFRDIRKQLRKKGTMTIEDKVTNEYKFPSRKDLWDAVLTKTTTLDSLKSCLLSMNDHRIDSIGTRVTDLYNKVSSKVHKPDNSDRVIIRNSALYQQEVCYTNHETL